MASTPTNGSSLVHSKGIKSIQLLCAREPKARLDNGPFNIIYAATLVYGLVLAAQGRMDDARILAYAAGAFVLVQVLLKLFMHWVMEVKAATAFFRATSVTAATHVMVVPTEFAGAKEIVPVTRRQLDDGRVELAFDYRKQKMVFSGEEGAFVELPYPVKERFGYYHSHKGFTKEAALTTASQVYGRNSFDMPLPQFLELLKEQMLAPFFVFQVFCVGLWCLDEYWYYSLFTLGMLVMFESTVVGQRLRNLKELRSLQTPKQGVQVYRFGKWSQVAGEDLLPWDIISIARPQGPTGEDMVVPADAVLLAGTCICDESILTGESTPQWKAPLPEEGAGDTQHLSIKRDKRHVLFGGTKILQHTGDKQARLRTPDGGCLAMVLRSSFETEQGRLMRTILHSTDRVTANNWETGCFILFLLVFAVAASAYVLKKGLESGERSMFKLYLNCVMIITSVIPPELPMELSIAVNHSLMALVRMAVFCTEPFRIPFAGKVTVCCFDKTGTLTSDDLLLEGVVLPQEANDDTPAPLLKDATALPLPVQRVLAGCQSLVTVEGRLVGDPLERAALTLMGWKVAGNAVSSPAGKPKETVTILHRFTFSSSLKRMAAIIKLEVDGAPPQLLVVAKGAPEVMEPLLDPLPPAYRRTYKHYAAEGGRVLCLAYKQLDAGLTADDLRAIKRDEAERGLALAGCAVFQTPLKADSEPALRMLAESRHQLVMITGDAALTACHVAAQVHIVDRPVLILTHLGHSQRSSNLSHGLPTVVEPDAHYCWVSPDERTSVPFSRAWEEVHALACEYDLCLTGDALTHIQQLGLEDYFVPLTQVFARVSPEQKELILRSLRAAGGVTLMCGDGTNDVGALKAAHVGIALLHAATKPKPSAANGASGSKEVQPAQQGQPGQPGPGRRTGSQALEATINQLRQQGKPVPRSLERMHEWTKKMEEQEDVQMVKPGDASMAAPFTAKQDSVMPCTHIIKQGRSTLVTMVQMFKILGLLCLSTAYSLSVMYQDGVKLGDVQATLQGFLTAGLFFCISNAKPLQRLSPQRPHPNIFCVYLFASLLGQFACHITFLIMMYKHADRIMSKEERQTPDAEFKPNLVNTVCFLVQFSIQVMTFAVNYVGHPFNNSIAENKGMYSILQYSAIGYCVLVLDPFKIGSSMSLVPIPGDLQMEMVLGALGVFMLTLMWEHTLRRWFPAKLPPAKGYEMFTSSRHPRLGKLKHA